MGKQLKALFEQELPPDSVLLDLNAIQGFDISSVNTFQRVAQQAKARGVALSFTAAPARLISLLEQNASSEIMESQTPETAISLYRYMTKILAHGK